MNEYGQILVGKRNPKKNLLQYFHLIDKDWTINEYLACDDSTNMGWGHDADDG